MTSILLTLLALNWLFYLVCGSLILWTYYLVKDGDDSTTGGYVLMGLVFAWSLYYFDGFRALVLSWPGGAYLALAYLGAGLVVMGVKWVITLADFKRRAAEWVKRYPKQAAEGDVACQMSRHLYDQAYSNKVTREDDGSVHLNHRAFPLSNWCVFWPLFTLSIVLDEAVNGVKRVVRALSGVLDRMAKMFAVKV